MKMALVPYKLVNSAGYNVCIFAYGQTGSGKTHTMSGSYVADHDGRGINYRALDDLFALNAARAGEVGPCPWTKHLSYFTLASHVLRAWALGLQSRCRPADPGAYGA